MACPTPNPLGALVPHGHFEIEGAADGPLAGLSFVAKDNYDVAGHATGAGNPTWLATHKPAGQNALAVQRLLEAGAGLMGKTVLDELAYSLDGENVHYGTPVNPAAPDRIPGGSSSGSASAVAGGLVPFALGSDTGGSVRVPASYCGIWGMRPTHGRIPLQGVVPLAPSFDTVGWFAGSAELLRRVGAVLLRGIAREGVARAMESEDAGSGQVRARPTEVLIAADTFALVTREVRDALRPALEELTRRIGRSRRVTLAPDGLSSWAETFRTLQTVEIGAAHGGWIKRHRPTIGPGIRERFERAVAMAAAEMTREGTALARHRQRRDEIRALLDEELVASRVLVLPTAPFVAPERGRASRVSAEERERLLALTSIAGLAGLPQISMPLASLDGCPLGLSLIGPRNTDESLAELVDSLY